MKYFWNSQDDIPEGKGYKLFSLLHIIWILISIGLISFIVLFYKNSDINTKALISKTIALIILITEIIKLIVIVKTNNNIMKHLPLEICSFAGYTIILDALFNIHFFNDMLPILYMPAAFCALILPTTSNLPFFNYHTIHQFVFHSLIVGYILAKYVCGEYNVTYLSLWSAVIKMMIISIPIYISNNKFKTNNMFMRDPYGNSLLQMIWDKTGGGKKYVNGIIAFAILGMHIFFVFIKLIEMFFS